MESPGLSAGTTSGLLTAEENTMHHSFNFRIGLAAATLALGASAHAVSTVGLYAPNPNALPITDATSNSGANGITLANFRSLVSTAYAANLGGVLDFEAGTGWTTTTVTTVDATYGASGANSLTLARTDGGFGFNTATNNGTNVVSGTGYLGKNAADGTFTFSRGLSAFGITLVPRGADRTATLTLSLDNGSTLVTSSQSITTNTTAVFFGALAPVGRTIVGVQFADRDLAGVAAFNRYDDLGFVVAPVPEPASLTALALGGLALLRKRRK